MDCVDGTCAIPVRPTVLSVTPSNCTTSGGCVVTIKGYYFGNKATVYFLDAICTRSSGQYVSDQQIVCTVPAGIGRNVPVRVDSVVTGTGVANSSVFSYLPPVITSAVAPTKLTSGGGIVTITGRNFGASTLNVTVTFGSFVCV
ncbi:MAG: IPT/TIG domain-containing protein, partial [Anaerolineae bacterium]|nr:IPT/TIG domain-containing protein [Anaerolineae bacterium]